MASRADVRRVSNAATGASVFPWKEKREASFRHTTGA